jgi:hypothetical protein
MIANSAPNIRENRRSLKRAIRSLLSTLFLVPALSPAADLGPPGIPGIGLGTPKAELHALFEKHGVPVSPVEDEKISVPRLPIFLEGVKHVKCSFENEKLKKIVILFAIPPQEPTASALIKNYTEEKERLKATFGLPSGETAELNAPGPQHRYEWLSRGRGYFRSIRKTPEILITLRLYGADEGLVFREIYEKP